MFSTGKKLCCRMACTSCMREGTSRNSAIQGSGERGRCLCDVNDEARRGGEIWIEYVELACAVCSDVDAVVLSTHGVWL